MKIKKLLCLLLCAVMMLGVFTGCGNKNDDTTESSIEVEKPKPVTSADLERAWITPNEASGLCFFDGDKYILFDMEEEEYYGGTYTIDGNNIEMFALDGQPVSVLKNVKVTSSSLEYTADNGNKVKWQPATESQTERMLSFD
ncbi:MAG: hypothetical protein IKB50_01345 [Clostridia bacterium]|nr:hypothetical protein [Clostridia bacterium]